MSEIMGDGGLYWWFGVVEDIGDPLKLGRVRVRIFGYHADEKTKVPTDNLPWAHPLQDITNASISGIGRSPTGLVCGSHVFGFFRDGPDGQQPVVMFSVGGIPSELADKKKGFNDPSGTYPKEKDVPDTNRLATGDETDKTIVQQKKDDRLKNVAVAWDSTEQQRWSEPETPYKAEYPHNKVFATASGMVEEWDDTSGKERHHTYHPSGSFEEVANGWDGNPDGTRVHKVKGNNYELIAGSNFVHIKGAAKVTVDGNANVYVGSGLKGGSLNLQVDGNINLQVGSATTPSDLRAIVYGSVDMSVLGDYRETILGNKYTRVVGNCVTETAAGQIVVSSFGDTIIKTKASSDLLLTGLGLESENKRFIKLNSLTRIGLQAKDPTFIPHPVYRSPFPFPGA